MASTAPTANNPFPTKRSGPAPGTPRNMSRVDIGSLKICKNVPPPAARSIAGKYAPLFSKLVSKDSIQCKPEEVDCVDAALRKYLRQTKKDEEFTVLREKASVERPNVGMVWMWPKNELEGVMSPHSKAGRTTAARRKAAGKQ